MNIIKCAGCKAMLPVDNFYKNAAMKTGHDTYCKECRKESSAGFAARNPDYQREYYYRVTKPRREAEKARRATNKS